MSIQLIKLTQTQTGYAVSYSIGFLYGLFMVWLRTESNRNKLQWFFSSFRNFSVLNEDPDSICLFANVPFLFSRSAHLIKHFVRICDRAMFAKCCHTVVTLFDQVWHAKERYRSN